MGLSWISCGDVAATLMTSPRVWKNNYCAKPPRVFFFFFYFLKQCTPTPTPIFINLHGSEPVGFNSCHGLSLMFQPFWQVEHCPWSHKNVERHARQRPRHSWWAVTVTYYDFSCLICCAKGTGFQFNGKCNFTTAPNHQVRVFFHTSFVRWRLLSSKALEMRNKCFSLVLYNPLMSWYVWK